MFRKRYGRPIYTVYNGVWDKLPKAGEFSRIFVFKVTLQSIRVSLRLLLTVSYRKNEGAGYITCSSNNFVGGPCSRFPCLCGFSTTSRSTKVFSYYCMNDRRNQKYLYRWSFMYNRRHWNSNGKSGVYDHGELKKVGKWLRICDSDRQPEIALYGRQIRNCDRCGRNSNSKFKISTMTTDELGKCWKMIVTTTDEQRLID